MHILIATPYLPWPLASGGNAAQFSTLQCLSEDHSFTLVCPVYSRQQLDDARELEQCLSHVRVRAVPCFTSLTTSQKLYGLVRKLFQNIKKLARSKVENSNLTQVLQLPFYPFSPLPASFITALSEELEAGVDLVQVEFVEMLSLGVWLPREIPKLFIHHQIHSVYTKRHLATYGVNPYSSYLATRMLTEEVSFLSAFDSIVVFSETDAEELSSLANKEIVHISPFPVPVDIGIAETVTPVSGASFVFVGSEEHDPNRDALNWLFADIWPLIRAALPEASLAVIGAWSSGWRIAHEIEGVDYPGFVKDLSLAMRGKIQLVSVRIGSGIRTKILAAMAQGVPVVSTTVGVEGINVRDSKHLLIRDNAEDFANAAISLVKDSGLSSHLANEALRFIQTHYNAESVRKARNEIYNAVVRRALKSLPMMK
ncbi:group 1 glycosyl transferase [Nostoc carneum NIES-2107]|nr:group 1 glycosyl transferase [Nostoc carneum NIES-2107]